METIEFRCCKCGALCVIHVDYRFGYRAGAKDPKRCPFKGGDVKAKWKKVE